MILFRHPEERDIVFYYAGKLADHKAATIFANEVIVDEAAALHISELFWTMVDSSINCIKEKNYPWTDGAEFWNEKILTSLSGSLERLGFIEVWDGVVDKQ